MAMRGEMAGKQSGAIALQRAMMRDDKDIDVPKLVRGANEFHFFVLRKIAQVENPDFAEGDDCAE